ncbi:DNA mismatch repair protein MutS [Rickettsiales endosymbiont of Stachyamoeba lipophora]|uniref:DNA mismatch repair protein MutS n=1 Tax=Rickettsiales endosymbiont of Stachyamoeba lipophora TaxID=2486578 RepID=UPI000F64ABF1|nr:DNA mismatch repair protein MutS [Rickettsiales endosymbiont of Stachyamoeba lipophora]AZL15753.1 DNA mismatch repair protein MutS [Rickettsiales endosymbiont of Stachyamoeba lipophora]
MTAKIERIISENTVVNQQNGLSKATNNHIKIADRPISQYTPIIQQYLLIKENHLDVVLFFRLGDFYELFFDDAITAAPILNVVLTRKAQGSGDIPMCGVPYHAANQYIERLIEAGFKVAICEQLETPEQAKKRGSQAIVKRGVVRIITPGTLLEENFLKSHEFNFLISLIINTNDISIGYADISTGLFEVCSVSINDIENILLKLNPQEIIVSNSYNQNELIKNVLNKWTRIITIKPSSFFELNKNSRKIQDYYHLKNLDLFSQFSKHELVSIGSLIEYISITHQSLLPRLQFPHKLKSQNYMKLDFNTIKHLQLFSDTQGNKQSSLFHVINKTKTASGTRALWQFLYLPLIDEISINQRLENVEAFISNQTLCDKVRGCLASFPDIERLLNRIVTNKAGPKDLLLLKEGLELNVELQHLFETAQNQFNSLISFSNTAIEETKKVASYITQAIVENPPLWHKEGGFIAQGFNEECDQLQNLVNNLDAILNNFKEKYKAETEVSSLKIDYSKNLGFCIVVSPQQGQKLKNNPQYILKQTLVSCLRFTTIELMELEQQIVTAKDQLVNKEVILFYELCALVAQHAVAIQEVAKIVGLIDIFSNFAHVARENNYVRPIVDNSQQLTIENGRHPIIEQVLKQAHENFQPNTCELNDKHIINIITGPNMGGKSTYLRMTALITILAQIGCFVPASAAHIGITDAVFARVGAGDELARGLSTFMVEMSETAQILINATKKSLIILDEVGRGTATFDGMAIAYACIEYIHHQLKSKCLFATHYHELTEMCRNLAGVKFKTVKVSEYNHNVVFHHQIIDGNADKSYGIFVAKIAGIPKEVLNSAQETLKQLEEKQLSLRIDVPATLQPKTHSSLEAYLKKLEIDELTPKQALEELYYLKNLLNKKPN